MNCLHIWGETKTFPLLLKNVFKIFVQVWNFSLLHSIPPVTGYSDPNANSTAENIVLNLQLKCHQMPAILVETLQHQQNASVSNPATFVGTKKYCKERDGASREGGTQPPFCF